MSRNEQFTSIEICAGAGGQALGLEWAGFQHVCAVELDRWAHETLTINRPNWNPRQADVRDNKGADFTGVDLVAGGVPCPPFSIAGRQLGADDDRDLFPAALEWVRAAKPKAVMLENVPGLASAKFESYRKNLFGRLRKLGFSFVEGRILNARDFGVSQLRPRFIIVALRSPFADAFEWPRESLAGPPVGELLHDVMRARGWKGATAWSRRANAIAPTLVGGSKLHGGPDLGPTRAKQAWRALGVDGMGIADESPDEDFPLMGLPRLTVRMTARIQGFPDTWTFAGRKTASYRQVGNAFPPPVARAVGASIICALQRRSPRRQSQASLFAGVG